MHDQKCNLAVYTLFAETVTPKKCLNKNKCPEKMSDIMLLRILEFTDTKKDIIFSYKMKMDMGFVNFGHMHITFKENGFKKNMAFCCHQYNNYAKTSIIR